MEISYIIEEISNFMYSNLLIWVLVLAGIFLTVKSNFVQFRLLGEGLKALREKRDNGKTSSFEVLMISTADRVGTGNIAGISTAVVIGGAGSIFWMWVIAILGMASSFIESTLAQIFKKKDSKGNFYGGPAHYIKDVLKKPRLAIIFSLLLILTYGIGFQFVVSFNLAQSAKVLPVNDPLWTPVVVGAVLAILFALCIIGGTKRITKVLTIFVPIMAILYLLVTLLVLGLNFEAIPTMFISIFQEAFNFQQIFAGFAGSCIILGIKRGLFSNEAGVGSAPNVAAVADVSHPVKQGLVQVIGVFLDTIIICTVTGFMLLITNPDLATAKSQDLAGIPFVEQILNQQLGQFGTYFVLIAVFSFGWSTLIGNYFYCEEQLKFLSKGEVKKGETLDI